jgi:hypothetical protein
VSIAGAEITTYTTHYALGIGKVSGFGATVAMPAITTQIAAHLHGRIWHKADHFGDAAIPTTLRAYSGSGSRIG